MFGWGDLTALDFVLDQEKDWRQALRQWAPLYLEDLLPPEKSRGKGTRGGRPLADPHRTLDAVFYVLRTVCQWKALPRSLGSGSTARRHFTRWRQSGAFERLWRLGLEEYAATQGIQWEWLTADGAITKAPLAARRLAPTPPTAPSAAPSARSWSTGQGSR